MPPNRPYRLIEVLGSCQVGTVWLAADEQDRRLTVAVLGATVAADDGWRDAFAVAAHALTPPAAGGPSFLYSDFTAAIPWVACAADDGPGAERVFLALGQEYKPVPPGETDAAMAAAAADLAAMGAPPPRPVAMTGETAPPTETITLPSIFSAPQAQRPDEREPEARPSRRRLWVGVVILVVVLAVAGGVGTLGWRWASRGLAQTPPPSTTQPNAAGTDEPLPTTVPLAPGLEPPKNGVWPTAWPRFGPTDKIRTLSGLEGLGFTVKVPLTWQCALDSRGRGFARYRCGVATGDNRELGGELTVRECGDPCDEKRRTDLRRAEEAWGLQWLRTGPYATYAESSTMEIDGARVYILVIVAYWRSGDEGAVDRQLVFRMTSPPEGAGQLRRVANYLRDTVIF